jgi:NTE family protein
MRRYKSSYLILSLSLVMLAAMTGLLFSQTVNSAPDNKEKTKRFRVALVLSGGGGRGLAHVGVIKKLEEYGIKVDYIVGTSMGALVGGIYSSGYDSLELEKIALSIDWDNYMNDSLKRRDLAFDEKQDNGRFALSIPFNKDGIAPISGVIEGVKLYALLNRLLFHVNSVSDFNRLPIPFACVATDIYTGEALILKRGDLPAALRASMSIPSVFTAVEYEDHMLVDGGLVMNLPVSVAKEADVDYVIAVDVGTPLFKKGDILSIPQIIDQIASFRSAESTKQQKKLCDLLITPDLRGMTSADFDRTAEFISRGERAAAGHEEELRRIGALQNNGAKSDVKGIQAHAGRTKNHITAIEVRGLRKVPRWLVDSRLQLKAPCDISGDQIEDAIIRVYGSRFFKKISYKIEQNGKDNVLVIEVSELASNFFNIGVRYDNDTKTALLINAEFRNMLGNGSRLDLETRLGEDAAFRAHYDIGVGWPFHFSGGTDIWFRQVNVYSYSDNNLSGEYKYNNYGMSVFGNLIFKHDISIGAGLKKDFMSIDKIISMENYDTKTVDYLNPYAFLKIDTLDRAAFTRSGLMLNAEAMKVNNSISLNKVEKTDLERYYADLEIYIPVHPRLTLFLGTFIGLIPGGDAPPYYNFSIGGMNRMDGLIYPFVGLRYMEKMGNNIQSYTAALQFEFMKNYFVLLRFSGAVVEDSFDDFFTYDSDFIYGEGLTLGYLSIFGPLEITLSHSSCHDFHFYASVGFNF